jgi:hypothetical protein
VSGLSRRPGVPGELRRDKLSAMLSNDSLLFVCGVFNVAFLVFHVFFWKMFDWRTVLRPLPFIDRQIMQILNACLIFVFGAFAFFCFSFPEDLVTTDLGRAVLASIAAFWGLRGLLQVLFFGVHHIGSVAFFAVFLAGALLHARPLLP